MKAPERPPDEESRLQALRALNLLDTPPEERFDCLIRTARRLFDVPVALVSLVDANRQWFKSRAGLEVAETSRDLSFCGHAILDDQPFVIEDALNDERFSDNPPVTGPPHVRFYAGTPLCAPDGSKIGTLCLLDSMPRAFGQDDLDALKDLASISEREIAAVRLATIDELTQLSNWRGFRMVAGQSLRLCVRQALRAALVFMDFDDFKEINDSHGHAEGERALAEFAAHLESACREAGIVARLGGDEFAILLIDSSRAHAEAVVGRVRQSIEGADFESRFGYSIAFSHGIVEFDPEHPRTIDELLAEGDTLMCASKRRRSRTPS